MTQKSHRLMFRFWLDLFKPEEEAIADTIELLKNERSFSKTIRDGIKLITNLREGKLDVLFELFPWVKAEFIEYMREIQPVTLPQTEMPAPAPPVEQQIQTISADQAWLEAEQERLEAERIWQEKRLADAEKALEAERKKIESERTQGQKAIQKQLDRLEQLLLQQGNQPIPMDEESRQLKSVSGGVQPIGLFAGQSHQASANQPKTVNAPQFDVPLDDEDEQKKERDNLFIVNKDENAGKRSSANFLSSLQKLQT